MVAVCVAVAGHEGATNADKLQMMVLTSQLANYGIGAWCLTTQNKRTEGGGNPNPDTGSYLDSGEEAVVALLALLFAAGPLILVSSVLFFHVPRAAG
eukprot:COSAG06_NODE_8739_length_2082_cov_3.134644_4_plen_97_part_00